MSNNTNRYFFIQKRTRLFLLQLGNVGLCLGNLPVHLGDLLKEVVLGGLDIVPLGRPVLGGGGDGLHLRLIARLLQQAGTRVE
jgi:hypothetical protein